MRHFAPAVLAAASLLGATLSAPARAEDVAEPRTGVRFPGKIGETTLLGVGLRTKSVLKVKVYAIGLYAADSALAGSLKDKTGPALYRELVWGDFPKEIHLRLVRDVSASQMQEAIRDALEKADKARTDQFVAYFGDIKTGEEYVLRWAAGGTLETLAKGTPKPQIADKNFAPRSLDLLGEGRPDDISATRHRVRPQSSTACGPAEDSGVIRVLLKRC